MAVTLPEWKDNTRNEDENLCSIVSDITVGDFVQLLVDGKYFDRNDGKPERYGGHVFSIDERIIGFSASHPENKKHGHNPYKEDRADTPRVIVEIETSRIERYRVIPQNF